MSSSRSSRRSARNRKEIVAPGFGTASDIKRLSQELGGSLPVTAVTAMMRAEGRGIRGKSDSESAPNPLTSPGTSNAWADFIQEEGVASNLFGAGTGKESEEPSNKRRKTTSSGTASAQAGSDEKFEYDLSILTEKKSRPFGSLVQSGTLDTTIVGRKNLKSSEEAVYHLNVPHSLMPKIAITNVFTSCNAAHAIALDKSNQAYGWGRNEGLCLGSPDDSGSQATVIPTPTLIASNVQSAALGKSHTIFLQTDGSLQALGSNKTGQCGWRQNVKQSGALKACLAPEGINFVKIACGEDFSLALDDQGVLYSTGSSEFGQLGNGETGEYFVTANKLAFANAYAFGPQLIFHSTDPDDSNRSTQQKKTVPLTQEIRLQDIACGKHHALALEAPASNATGTRLFSWGCGNYGCLGHNRQHDEYFPRLVEAFPKGMTGTKLAAGGNCSLVLTDQGHVYFWGVTKANADAAMKPQLVEALANNQHVVSYIGAGAGNVACCTEGQNTVVWGQGPYGELGLGGKKSSAKPAFVDSLSGVKVLDLACGLGSFLYVVEDDKSLPKVDLGAVETALKK